jgi:undecaprenyl-diphosphatase
VSALERIDLTILDWINPDRPLPFLDTFFTLLTKPPHQEWIFAAAALALLAWGRKRGAVALLALGVAIALSDQISASIMKPLFDRVRPCFAHPEVVRLVLEKQARSASLPSSHAANNFAAAVVLWSLHRRLGIGMLVLAALLSISRVYLGVHYPGDVLIGALLGAGIGWGVVRGRDRLWAWRRSRARIAQGPSGGPMRR